jgi:hypothetical protein
MKSARIPSAIVMRLYSGTNGSIILAKYAGNLAQGTCPVCPIVDRGTLNYGRKPRKIRLD